jgi:hypothetical protein
MRELIDFLNLRGWHLVNLYDIIKKKKRSDNKWPFMKKELLKDLLK